MVVLLFHFLNGKIKTIMKKIKLLMAFLGLGITLNSCYFPAYQSIAESNPYSINLSRGNWYLGNVEVNHKIDANLSDMAENTLQNCLKDSLYLSYGKRKAIYLIPILNDENTIDHLSLLKASKKVDYVLQIVGSIGNNKVGSVNLKPLKSEEKTSVSVRTQVFDVQQQKLIYANATKGLLSIENNREDVVIGKSAQSMLKKCLEKELKLLLKHGGCQKK